MNSSLECSTLSRLLTLNNQAHDLQNLLRQMAVPECVITPIAEGGDRVEVIGQNAIAELQEDIDRQARASLMVCWLGAPLELDD